MAKTIPDSMRERLLKGKWLEEEHPPIPIILFCPLCHLQHIDAAAERCTYSVLTGEATVWMSEDSSARCQREKGHVGEHLGGTDPSRFRWMNPPHKSHECHYCGCIWRPSDIPTTGVEKIETAGKRDTMFFNR